MNKILIDEATVKLALDALENSIDLVSQEARNAEELYGKYPTRLARIQGLVAFEVAHEKAITVLKALAEQPAPAAPVQQEPVAWVGCGECDCSFPCTKGGAACIRSSEEPATLADSDRADYEARIKRLGELLTLQHESGERLAARVMELEALADQPAPATYTCGACGVSMRMEQPAQQEVCGYEHHEYRPYGAPGEVRINAVLASQYKMPDGTIADDFQWLIDEYKADPNTIKLLPLYTTPQAQRKPLTPTLEADTGYSRAQRAAFEEGWQEAEAAHGIKENTLPVPLRPMQRTHLHVFKGEHMTKEEALAAIKLLSALESWALSQSARLPDYLHEDLTRVMAGLEKIVLGKQP